MSARRRAPARRVSPCERLHLLLAACCALTLTPLGLSMAVVVVVVVLVLARRQARRRVDRSVAVRGGVLAPAHQSGALDPARHCGQALAGP